MRNLIASGLLLITSAAASFEVPVDSLQSWVILSFSNIKPNNVSVDEGEMHVAVRSSASPLIYKFDKPVRITGFTLDASWTGVLNIPPGAVAGDKGADDFVLKFGIVESGDRRLNWLQRRIAADWIKQLFEMAPPDSGVSRINFLSTTQQENLLGISRTHPLSDLLFESRILYLDSTGPFEMSHDFAEPVEALGLWLSIDGDDTGSSFDLRISEIALRTE